MEAENARKIYILVYKRGGEYVGRCPQLELVATGKDADEAFESTAELVSEHLAFARENGFSWEDIATPVPPEIEEIFENAQKTEQKRWFNRDTGYDLDRVEIGVACPA